VQLLEPVAQPTRGPWGRLRVRAGGELERWLARARPWVPAVADLQIAGAADLDARVRPDAQGVDLEECSLAVNNLVAGNSRDAAWREPRLRLTARGRLETASDLFKIEEVRLETSVLTATAAGQLAHLSESRDLALSGKLQYDLQQLEPHLRPFLGQGVQVRGQAVRPFRLQGPLAGGPGAGVAVQVGKPDPLAGLTGEASLGWTRAQAYGCDVGPGNLKADLGGGWLRVQPIEATVNQGRLHLDPSVRLDPGPAEMFLGKGTSVDHFRLTPAACASALGYALPGLANVLEAEGEVSVALEAARVPLAAPAAAEITGKIVVHSGRIGPGSLVRELGTLLAVPGGASLARESVVPFRMANGRIYHSDLDLVFPELTIRTQGSVGLDGSLDLVAETTVPPKWVGGKVGKLLGGQPVRLPIRGTLASPKIDERALRAAMEQAAREIGEGAIRHELEKGLQDLFKPRK
jgi:translocation and assembly module TamB